MRDVLAGPSRTHRVLQRWGKGHAGPKDVQRPRDAERGGSLWKERLR